MQLSRKALSRYDKLLSKLEGAAYDYAASRISAYTDRFPGASPAAVRDFAIEKVNEAVLSYGDGAASLAADLYEQMSEAAGAKVKGAALDTSDVSGYIDREVRYQMGKFLAGDLKGFSDACGSKASDQVSRRANQTMRINAKRDGLRFARVPMGGETCTFCAMLASRGFVYRSAKTAGEGNHYHKHCRCKVIPGFDGMGVEGYDPDEWAERWRAFQEIDEGKGTDAEKLAMKRAVLDGNVTSFPRIDGEHSRSLDMSETNPNFMKGIEWQCNCQRCVPTYEMRRRGYDVTALPRELDSSGNLSSTDVIAKSWKSIFDGAQWIKCNGTGKAKIKSLLREWGEGSRAEVYVIWKPKRGGASPSAHVFVAENIKGRVQFIDPQASTFDCSKYFEFVKTGQTRVARMDNLKPSELITGCCEGRV